MPYYSKSFLTVTHLSTSLCFAAIFCDMAFHNAKTSYFHPSLVSNTFDSRMHLALIRLTSIVSNFLELTLFHATAKHQSLTNYFFLFSLCNVIMRSCVSFMAEWDLIATHCLCHFDQLKVCFKTFFVYIWFLCWNERHQSMLLKDALSVIYLQKTEHDTRIHHLSFSHF